MRKAEKLELAQIEYGLRLTQCPEHKLLVRHESNFWSDLPEAQRPKDWEEDTEGCWDCPVDGCLHHVHEGCDYPVHE